MFAYIVKRLISGVVVLFLVSMAIFVLFWYGPSEPARVVCDSQTSNRCTPERFEVYKENLGYNNPVYEEYGKFLDGLFTGREVQFGNQQLECNAPCLGYSYFTVRPVFEEMKERMPATISVAVGGAALYLLLGIPIGIAAARRRGTLGDKALVSGFLVVSSIPYYLFALLVWLFLTITWEIPLFAETGYFPITDNPAKWFSGLLLAWIALGIFGCTSYTRYTRGSMVEVLGEDYIRTAKAKGLTANRVVYKHGLRSALVPVITIFGIDFGTLLAGTIFTERIFDIEGIGLWALQAVNQKDLPIVSATALFGAAVLIISNLVVDVVYSVLDPRVRLS
ncbi:ABC transporter permease [Nocardioides sp. TF02-7]|uniref:ABC transporter permease n=1 Tax=Nocardioides sp. TF02-7 TaxID=2917724 RepID=UPI001F053AE5|nr:ABC transporter permease [Nocardioides sp. TF02-7]UMG92645.1 ABC transporter permease [Nocardioides sp. TF02-7]